MLRKVTGLVAFALVVLMSASAPLSAQGKVEASFLVGWTFSDGVDVGDQPPILSQDGELFDRIDPDDSFKWGFMVGFNATPNVEVGFQYGRQPTTLQASGTTDREIGKTVLIEIHRSDPQAIREFDARAFGRLAEGSHACGPRGAGRAARLDRQHAISNGRR